MMNLDRLRRSRLAELIEETYPDPDEYDTIESVARAWHRDIAALSVEDLDRERLLARLRWAVSPDPSPWLLERIARLDREAEQRRRRT